MAQTAVVRGAWAHACCRTLPRCAAVQADAASAEDTPVFLYHKLYLRPGAAPPAQDPLPVFEVTGVWWGGWAHGVGVTTGVCVLGGHVMSCLEFGSKWVCRSLVWWGVHPMCPCCTDAHVVLTPRLSACCTAPVPSLPHVGLRHPLHSAHSPLIRALPDYEAQFSQQLGEARAFWEASQQRLHK